MGRPSAADQRAIAAFASEASLLSLDAPHFSVATRMQALLDVNAVVTYSAEVASTGIQMVDPVIVGAGPTMVRRVTELTGRTPPGMYTAARPEPGQRNRILEFPSFHGALRRRATMARLSRLDLPRDRKRVYESAAAYAETWKGTEVFAHGQLRALVCDHESLLMYVNAMHDAEFTGHQRFRFKTALPALHRRLAFERHLAVRRGERLMLDASLEQIPRPAMVIGPRGSVMHANAAARARYDAELRSDLGAALRGEPSAFVITKVGAGSSTWSLAVRRAESRCSRERAQTVAKRWHLTPQQTRVLLLLAEGLPNKTIAATLSCTEKTVEFHVTSILGRVGVESRAAVVARVWMEPID